MESRFEKVLVTAALPYANGYIHLGHLAGAYLPADIYARYQRAMKRDVLFICGSDEHGVAITVTAEKLKISPQAVVELFHPANKESFDQFGMSFDNYSRTTLPLHYRTSQEFFADFHKRNILKEKAEKQLYCERDKMFLADRYVEGTCPNCKYLQARGDQCENCGTWLSQTDLIDPKCKLCGTSPIVRETSHWYFPLGHYQQKIEDYIKERNQRDGWKENVLRYCEGWFKDGLQDRAVSRDLTWGVPVPIKGYEHKVIYVWFDAVLGYISSSKEWAEKRGKPNEWKKYWQDPSTKYVAFIGKDNVVFHCIVFPSMLMAKNEGSEEQYVLPENVPANEFLNLEGQKFSKSRGWAIDVRDLLNYFPADLLRYTLAVNLPEARDSDFYFKDFQARTNNELADILGNLVNRTFAFTEKNFGGVVPELGERTPLDDEMLSALKEKPAQVSNFFEHYRFREGVAEAMNLARRANKYFNDSEPWKTSKNNPKQCATTLHISLQVIRTLAIILEPVIPHIAMSIWTMLNLEGTPMLAGWTTAGELILAEAHRLNKSEILVAKIEDKKIEDVMGALLSAEAGPAGKPMEFKPTITLDDFKKVDLRIGKIVSAEKIPKSEKLLKLQMEIGDQKRQVLAGIAQYYDPAELVGKSVVVVANLHVAKLMGQESQGMILAASNDEGKLHIVCPLGEISSGSIVK